MIGQRYSSNGALVGIQFLVATGGIVIDDIDAELLADGRVAVSFTSADSEIRMEIIDTRDAANDPGVYAPEDGRSARSKTTR